MECGEIHECENGVGLAVCGLRLAASDKSCSRAVKYFILLRLAEPQN